jgi:surface antigen
MATVLTVEIEMSKILFVLPVMALALSACTPAQQTAGGAATGALVGAAVSSGNDRAKGAIVGAIVGGAAASLLGQTNQPGQCRYRDANGQEFIAACP